MFLCFFGAEFSVMEDRDMHDAAPIPGQQSGIQTGEPGTALQNETLQLGMTEPLVQAPVSQPVREPEVPTEDMNLALVLASPPENPGMKLDSLVDIRTQDSGSCVCDVHLNQEEFVAYFAKSTSLRRNSQDIEAMQT
ncbi:hypothetical protein F66182_17393 [Fusarium sp. NRRL 66182]|nr:hypothetical protein F66182_17393 [Fusarium sp. NRRL 66182]